MKTDKPIPPNTRLHDKIKHLPLDEQKQALSILNKLAPKHNSDVLKNRKPANQG